MQFPCEFPIKAMGLANDDFEAAVLTIVHKHCPELTEGSIVHRHSKDRKYLAITVTIHASNQQQLDAIYQELTDSSHVLMAL